MSVVTEAPPLAKWQPMLPTKRRSNHHQIAECDCAVAGHSDNHRTASERMGGHGWGKKERDGPQVVNAGTHGCTDPRRTRSSRGYAAVPTTTSWRGSTTPRGVKASIFRSAGSMGGARSGSSQRRSWRSTCAARDSAMCEPCFTSMPRLRFRGHCAGSRAAFWSSAAAPGRPDVHTIYH
jgi:hypothetical protein